MHIYRLFPDKGLVTWPACGASQRETVWWGLITQKR